MKRREGAEAIPFALLAATKSGRGTAPRDEVDYEGDHGANQQDMNEKSCDMKSQKTAGP
jgi:hypothetical protein